MENMTVEELRAYLEALKAATYVPGQGFRVQMADGSVQILSADEVKQATAAANSRIDDLTTSTLEAAAGAVGRAFERLGEPAVAPPSRGEQIEAGRQQVSKAKQKLVDDVLKARAKALETAQQVAGTANTPAPEKTQEDIDRWEQKVKDAEAKLAKAGLIVTPQGEVRPVGEVVSRPPGAVTGRSRGGAGGTEVDSRGRPVRMGPGTTSGTGPAPVPSGAAPTVTPPSALPQTGGGRPVAATADMRERATGTGAMSFAGGTSAATTTTATGGTAATTAAGGTPTQRRAQMGRVTEQQWMAEFQRLYPAYKEWTTDAVAQHFGQDFIDLIRKVSSGEVEYTDEEFQAALRNTQYGMRTNQYQMQFDALRPADQQNLIRVTADQIRKDYGDVEFTESQIAELARVAARSGLTGTGLRQEVYRAAFRMSEGQEVPMLRMQALRGEDADRINKVARAYGRKATDAEIRSILTGEPLNGVVLTEEGLTQRLQAEAKALFPQFADQIDAGVTLETIGDRYKKYAADLLEMPEDNIDMFSGPYLKAFGDREKGPLSLFEWQQTVKSDPTFGWQYTKQANDQATSLGLAMARAFGKVQ